jgi:hypothetical protein
MNNYITNMVIYTTFTFLLFFSLISTAQLPPPNPSGISFEYDITGNRTSRVILFELVKPKSMNVQSDSTEIVDDEKDINESSTTLEPFVDAIGERKVLIYPNPTRGNLKVEFVGGAGSEQPFVLLYSITGTLIYSSRATDKLVLVNLSNQPNGTYILKVLEGSLCTTWKIIKQ